MGTALAGRCDANLSVRHGELVVVAAAQQWAAPENSRFALSANGRHDVEEVGFGQGRHQELHGRDDGVPQRHGR